MAFIDPDDIKETAPESPKGAVFVDPDEVDKPKKAGFYDQLGTALKQSFVQPGNLVDRAGSGAAAGLASLFGQTADADKILKEMNDRVASRNQWANPENAQVGPVAGVLGFIPNLPANLVTMGLAPSETGQTMLDVGESLPRAMAGAGITAAGNAAMIALPAAVGKTVASKAVTGAGIGAGQYAATQKALESISQTEEGKKLREITANDAIQSALMGAVFGGMSSTPNRKPVKQPQVVDRLQAIRAAEREAGEASKAVKTQEATTDSTLPETFIADQQGNVFRQEDIPWRDRALEQEKSASTSNLRDGATNVEQKFVDPDMESVAVGDVPAIPEGQMNQLRGQRGAINLDMFKPEFDEYKKLDDNVVLRMRGGPEPTVYAIDTTDKTNPQVVGSARFGRDQYWKPTDATQNLETSWVETLPEKQRRGLAQDMYTFVSELGSDIRASAAQTPSGKRMWDGFEQKGLVRMEEGWGDPRRFQPLNKQRGVLFMGESGRPSKEKEIARILSMPIQAEIPTAEATIRNALENGKDGSGSVNFSAGASLEAQKRVSPLIRDVSRVVQGYKNQGERIIRETVFPAEASLRKLSKTEITDLASVFKLELFDRKPFTAAQLAEAGLNENQLLAYQRTRDMFRSALKEQNSAREALGQEPISEADAYVSSRWRGDFRRPVKDAAGNLKWYLAATSKSKLEAQTQALLKEFPDLVPGDVATVRSLGRKGPELDAYNQIIDVLGPEDPAVLKIAEWVKEQTLSDTARVAGQEKHFQDKANIRGFVGDRPGTNPFNESVDFFQEQVQYSKNAQMWSKMQEAGIIMKDVLANQELQNTQPNNMKYVREYYKDNLGVNQSIAAKYIEDQIRATGHSPEQVSNILGAAKSLWIKQKLTANLGYVLSNVIQAGNILPHVTLLQSKFGGNPVRALTVGPMSGALLATGHIGGIPDFYSKLSKIPGIDTFTLEAMKYAEDNAVVSKTTADESPIENSFSPTYKLSRAADFTISAPETILRSVTYMTYVEQLRNSKQFKSNKDIYRQAEEQTNISMGDYRTGEKAMFFNKAGIAGEVVNVLQTYPINFYNQYSLMSREAGRGNPIPLLTMLGTHGFAAGLMGVPFFNDLDKFWEWTKGYLAENHPTMWNDVKDVSLKQMAIDLGGGSLLYGGVSEATGVALTSRAAAPAGAEMLTSPLNQYIDMADQVGALGKLAMDPLNRQKQAQSALLSAPAGMTGFLETGPFKDQTSMATPNGPVYGRTKDLSSQTGMYAPTPEEERLRAFSLRSQKEAVTREMEYRTSATTRQADTVIRALPGKVFNHLRNNNQEKAAELIKLYTELSGREMSSEQLENELMQAVTTPSQRAALKKNPTLQDLLAQKRLSELLTKMGYK